MGEEKTPLEPSEVWLGASGDGANKGQNDCKMQNAKCKCQNGCGYDRVRCGTSGAPNYEEACAAESRKDFVHKLRVVLKELRERRCWLRFIVRAELLPAAKLASILEEANELCNIVGKSVLTARTNDANNRRKSPKESS
jgi:four helix bundle protein